MVKHMAAVRCRDGFTAEENLEHMKKTKELLEGLKNKIQGIVKFTVYIALLPSSNMAVVFDALFESKEESEAYQVHSEYVKAAEYIGSAMKDRIGIDYYI